MKPVGGLPPELDRFGDDADRAPIGRALRRRLEHVHEVGVAVAQRLEILDRLALTGDERLHAVGERALGEQLLCQGALRDLGAPGDVGLTPELGPVKEQRDVRVDLELAGLAGPQRGGEENRAILDALEADRPGGRTAVGADRDERHRRRALRVGAPLLDPLLQEGDRLLGAVLERHRTTSWAGIAETTGMRAAIEAAPAQLPLPGGKEGATVTLHPLLCGELRSPAGWFEAEPGLVGTLRAFGVGVPKDQLTRIPIVAFLIEHPAAGPILIDTGFHRVLAEGTPGERNHNLGPIGRLIGRNIRMQPEQTAAAQLRARGIEPEAIRLIVMTHLHFDHGSALADFPAATVVVSAPEWRTARARGSSLQGYPAPQLDPRLTYRTLDLHGPAACAHGPFERALDLFGDGSLTLLDTPGHSPGHLSVLLRLREREALIAGDAIYTIATLREGRRPWRSQNRSAFERSLRALQAYDREHPDALIVPGHDMDHWETLAERYD